MIPAVLFAATTPLLAQSTIEIDAIDEVLPTIGDELFHLLQIAVRSNSQLELSFS